jgi:cytochrome c-type biogenesis protein CcmH/NrfF
MLIAVALLISCAVSAWPGEQPARTNDERVQHIAQQIRCPTCAGLAVGQSDAPLALSAREEISRRVSEGQSDDGIKDYFVSVYGASALMSPPRNGLTGVAWLLPIGFGLVALVAVVLVGRRWVRHSSQDTDVSLEDRQLVEEALRAKR